jgi:pSer/pThr/pTyr-binding forkhead associated (FHA) protein
MADVNVLKLRLSLMGRPVRNYTFDKPTISIGRDPAADVFVDNPGVSRDHFRLERTATGDYQVVDLGSANGTFLNDQAVHTAVVRNNDVVRFGKYTLWVGYDIDRRASGPDARRAPDAQQHTVVLSRTELGQLLETSREKEAVPPPAAVTSAPASPVAPPRPAAAVASSTALAVTFLLGAAVGAAAMYLLLPR